MAHCIIPDAEKILDKKYKVLDKGFVRLVDYMGSDQRIVQSARVSYGKGTKSFRRDKGLINYLLRNEHTSPFEQVVFTFHIKLPIFVARQWIRHRTARVNEISGRYSVMAPQFYLPAENDIAKQSSDNKQGRSDEPLSAVLKHKVLDILNKEQKRNYENYSLMLNDGIARELARINLPLSLYTEWYWQIDLHNLFHFLKLRMDPHAQKEIRLYSSKIHRIASKICPCAVEAFEEHILNGSSFSGSEKQALKNIFNKQNHSLSPKAFNRLINKLGFDPTRNNK